jgi:hypothetical protein
LRAAASPFKLAKNMKKALIILTALLAYTLAAEELTPLNPFEAKEAKPGTGPDSPVSMIKLDSHHNVNDAIKQIIAGLPPEGRSYLVVDIPEEELTKMPMKEELRLRNVPLPIVLKYLGKKSPVGYRFWNNAWHISDKRADDIITVNYRISKALLEQLGIEIGPGQSFTTKKGKQMWPPESYWAATYTTLDPDAGEKQDAGKTLNNEKVDVLRLLAARSYHEEFSALLLLKERGYDTLSLDR